MKGAAHLPILGGPASKRVGVVPPAPTPFHGQYRASAKELAQGKGGLTLKGRWDSSNLIQKKAKDLSETEVGATLRFHIFSVYSAFSV